jgi:hypothetical protein
MSGEERGWVEKKEDERRGKRMRKRKKMRGEERGCMVR